MTEQKNDQIRSKYIDQLAWMFRVRWISACGVGVIASILFFFNIIDFPLHLFLIAIVAEMFLNQPHAFIVQRCPRLDILASVHLVLDIIIISWALHLIGGMDAFYFVIVYALPILFAGYILSFWIAVFITTLSIIAFTGITYLEYFQILPAVPVISLDLSLPVRLGLGLIMGATLYLISYFGGYLREQVRKKEEEIKQVQMTERTRSLSKHLEQMQTQNNELIAARTAMRNAFEDLKEAQVDLKVQKEQLEKMTVELERSNKDLEQFAYMSSHDLQEPLRKIIAFGELLITENADQINSDGKDYLERMRSAAFRMKYLIEGLLQYSRVSTQAKPFEEVDLNEVAQEVFALLELKIKETNAVIDIGNLPVIKADRLQMGQLFQNFISNALKFRKEGITPHITIKSVPGENEWEEIIFQDNGIGFDEKYLDQIFLPFRRIHGRGEYEGSGIGLSICQKIVHRHGGTIRAKSAPGKGSTFIIRLLLD